MVKPESRCPWRSKQITQGKIRGGQALVARSACALRVRQCRKWLQSQVAQGARCTAWRGLTSRSSGAPTAGRQARALLWLILHHAGLASCRCRPLNSNVRPHLPGSVFRLNTARPRGLALSTAVLSGGSLNVAKSKKWGRANRSSLVAAASARSGISSLSGPEQAREQSSWNL